MSMNLHVQAEKILYEKLNKKTYKKFSTPLIHNFNLWQTPTKITYEILNSKNYFNAYKDWVSSISLDEKEPIYDFKDDSIIGHKIVNYGKDHIEELEKWIKEHEGWDITWYDC